MAKVYVYSTLSNDVAFNFHDKNGNISERVFIAGKANIPNKHMLTSRGVSTEITKEQAEALMKHRVFKEQYDAGFLLIEGSKQDAEKVSTKMNNNDPSQPDTAERLEVEHKNKPKKSKK